MVRFLSKPAIEEQHHSCNQASSSPSKDSAVVSSGGDQPNLLLDVSFADSLLNFDFINGLLEDSMEPDTASLENVDIREFASVLRRDFSVPCDEVVDGSDSGCLSAERVAVKEEALELQSGVNLGGGGGGSIEEDMGRVSLVANGIGEVQIKEEEEMEIACSVENDVNNGATNGGEADSDSDGESSSSSSGDSSSSDSSSSDDDDDDEEEEKEEQEEGDSADAKVDIELKVEEEVGGDEVEEGEIIDEGDNLLGRNDDGDDEEEDEDDDVADEVSKMVEWSDVDEEEEGDVGVEKSPIRSKNELKALPPVPPVDAVLLPHHEMQPVGLVSSVLGTQVIVEGAEKHNPLNEGSIIWLTEKRSPLGLVDEIFGPVKNPFYIVRFNSESEVPEGLSEGTLVSFVPEFAGFVLSNQNLYKKGYDASGENDEELSEEIEFSDDEKEAEYRRMKKMVKRGMNNGQTTVGNKKRNKKKADERRGDWKNDNNPSWQQARNDPGQHHTPNGNQHSASPRQHDRTVPGQQHPPNSCQQAQTVPGQQHPPNLNQQHPPNLNQQHPPNLNQQHNNASPGQSSAVMGQGMNGGNPFVPPFRPMLQQQQQQQNPGFFSPPNGNWPNGLFLQHQQNPAAPPQFGGFPAGNNVPNPLQMQIQSLMQQLQQQLNPGNVMLPGGQPNFFQGPGFMPWPAAAAGGMMNQGGGFNQPPPFGMGGFLPQPANPTMMNNNSMNTGDQGTMAPGVQPSQPSTNAPGKVQSPQQSGNGLPPRNFNAGGAPSNRGRRPFRGRGGGGRFRGRGGR